MGTISEPSHVRSSVSIKRDCCHCHWEISKTVQGKPTEQNANVNIYIHHSFSSLVVQRQRLGRQTAFTESCYGSTPPQSLEGTSVWDEPPFFLFQTQKSETRMTASVLKQDPDKMFKRTLFIWTKPNMQIFGVLHFIKPQNNA